MKRTLAFLCVLALVLSLVPATAFAATQDVQAELNAGAETIVLEADASNITITRDTIIDLNGHDLDGVSVLGGTLYLQDSQTADYTVADGVYGQVTNVTGNVKAAEGYLQVGNSFHAVNLDIYAMTLRASDVGVYYKSNFAADEIVAAEVESFGVALSVVTAPNASNLETYCGYSEFTGFEAGEGANSVGTSTLLKNIMKASNTDAKNGKNAAMPVYGRAYIKTADGYFFGETVKRSLQEQVEAIDGVWSKLTDAQKSPVLAMLDSYTSVMEGWNIPNIRGIQTPGADAEIQIPISVTAENGIVTEAVTVEANGVSVTVPAGTKLAANASGLTVIVTEKETSEAGLTLEESEVLMPMDVHVEGLAADNTAPLTIFLGKVMAENLNMGNYAVYHVENGKANEMVLIPVDAEFTAHNQYKYSLDGELTLYMATFSEVAVVSNEDNAWKGERDYSWYNTTDKVLYIRNADQLAAFSAIVGDMAFKEVEVQVGGYTLIDIEPIVKEDSFSGKTVVLLADIDLGDKDDASGHLFYPIGYGNSNMSYEKPSDGTVAGAYMLAFEGTFDGNGHTISNFYQNTWQMWGDYNGNNYDSAMGLFAYVYGGTIKNLTVDHFSSDGEFAPTGVIAAYAINSTFENIAITNCNPRVYNTGNGGIVGIGGSSTDGDEDKLTFNNITIDNTNKITALWGSWDVACGGLVGMFYGKGHVNMTNCHVAAQIDVYNDVCGNYQYYWYRYSGMLIGTNKNMVTDANGYTVPETKNFHAENCTVHFGTWNDYYYCELVANTLASYTHDHQFSRLTQIKSLDEIKSGDTWLKSGNFLLIEDEIKTCYHIVNDNGTLKQHKHEDAGKETVNGETVLKEDKQVVYLPFNQLFTGYGWGVKHIPLGAFDGVTILDRVVADSVVKFESIVQENTFEEGEIVTLDKLFQAAKIKDEKLAIKGDKVQVTVSPANEDATAGCVYTPNTEDWTKGTLQFTGYGAAKVTITDYYFCTPTTIEVYLKKGPDAMIGDVEYEYLQDALNAAEDGNTITLLHEVKITEYLDVYTANNGETERFITLDLNGNTISPAADYQYKWYPMVFVGINQTLIIKNGTIKADEHTVVGVYGALELENANIVGKDEDEQAVCIWNWGEDDKYYEDCQFLLTGSATITGSAIEGGILAEGPITLAADAKFDKLYLNTKTGHGKYILPSGYGLVKTGSYYTDLHKHEFNANGACDICGLTYTFVQMDLANIESTDTVVITITASDGKVYAMTNNNGTDSAPTAVAVTVDGNKITGNITNELVWNISNVGDSLTIYPNGDSKNYLYCNYANNGLRVGNTYQSGEHNEFVISAEGYLYNVSQGRYVGVYNGQDWRGYTTINNYIENQTLTFYVMRSNCKHGNTEMRQETAATCTVAGHEKGEYCLDCDTYISEGKLISAPGHDFKLTKREDATCTEKGKETYHCSECNKVKTKTLPAAHTWSDATCTAPMTCTACGTTEGEPLGHSWIDASCEASKICSVCKVTEGEALGHSWIDATCTAPKTCSVCSATEGEPLGHIWSDATCTAPKTCTVCGATEGTALGHSWTDATCTAPKTCSVCGAIEGEALGHTEEKIAGKAATCTENGLTDGVKCSVCDVTLTAQKEIPAAGHNYVDGNCTACGQEDPDAVKGWVLVTDASALKAGDQVVIVAKDSAYALSTVQNNNNRGQASVTKSGNTITFVSNVQILTLENGTTSGTFAFYTGSGYLYAASSGSNYLRTQTTNNANGSWKVTLAADGTATIVAQGTNTRNTMQYNQTSSLFACYSSASQKAVVIYKLTTISGSTEPDVPGTGDETTITFNLGANGSATHADGSSESTYSETVDGYTLNITGGTSMYTGARDEKGNSCIKLGTSKKTGGFSFTVSDDVTSVTIYIAKYKDDTSKIKVNDTTYTLTEDSNNGEYDAITIDTTTTKTITVTTVSGGIRAMVNTIDFVVTTKS